MAELTPTLSWNHYHALTSSQNSAIDSDNSYDGALTGDRPQVP